MFVQHLTFFVTFFTLEGFSQSVISLYFGLFLCCGNFKQIFSKHFPTFLK